jgi:hypothetical protein
MFHVEPVRPHRESRRLRFVCSAWEGIDDVDYLRRRKPVGGFLFLTVTQLSMVWWCYQKRLIQLKDLRVWFAAQELVARRCQMKDRQRPRYGMEELRRLVAGRGGEKDSLRRLQQIGLLTWDASHIAFALTPADLQVSDLSSLHEMLARIQNNRRKVPVPRQVVRFIFIAAPSKRCAIATILGHLIRCLYYRAGECRSGGFCGASWVAEVFHIDVRNVKAARKFLAGTLGLLECKEMPQSILNRFGSKVFINLSWDGSAVGKSDNEPSELPPPQAQIDTGLPPLEEHTKPFQDLKHQKPSEDEKPTGVLETPKTEKPALKHIVPEDLLDTTRLLALFQEAQTKGIMGGSESKRLIFVATAERARLTAITNAPGLFAELVRRRLWHFITQDDEDRAQKRLREHFYGGRGDGRPQAMSCPRPSLSKDALFVSDVSAKLWQHGFLGDVFSVVSRELPDWTQERWENAQEELSTARTRREGERGFHRASDFSVLETLQVR